MRVEVDTVPPATSVLIMLLSPSSVSEVGVDQGINEPNAVVANRQWQEPSDTRLAGSASTLQCSLEAKSGLDHILEAEAHHIAEILCAAVLRLSRQRGNGNSRRQESNGNAAEHWDGVSPLMMPGFGWLRLLRLRGCWLGFSRTQGIIEKIVPNDA